MSSLSLLAGAWPAPLLAFALLELSFSAVESVAARRRGVLRARTAVLRRSRIDTAGGILQATP
ncbi:MAG: hypothetical protein ABI317_04130 [Gaiellales bacterium]